MSESTQRMWCPATASAAECERIIDAAAASLRCVARRGSVTGQRIAPRLAVAPRRGWPARARAALGRGGRGSATDVAVVLGLEVVRFAIWSMVGAG